MRNKYSYAIQKTGSSSLQFKNFTPRNCGRLFSGSDPPDLINYLIFIHWPSNWILYKFLLFTCVRAFELPNETICFFFCLIECFCRCTKGPKSADAKFLHPFLGIISQPLCPVAADKLEYICPRRLGSSIILQKNSFGEL